VSFDVLHPRPNSQTPIINSLGRPSRYVILKIGNNARPFEYDPSPLSKQTRRPKVIQDAACFLPQPHPGAPHPSTASFTPGLLNIEGALFGAKCRDRGTHYLPACPILERRPPNWIHEIGRDILTSLAPERVSIAHSVAKPCNDASLLT
jgi:hypothetical protein